MKKGKRSGRSRCRIFLCYVINFVKNEIVLLSSKFRIQNLVYFFLSAVVMSVCLSMCMCWFHHEKYSILFVCTLINEREKEEQPFLQWKQKQKTEKRIKLKNLFVLNFNVFISDILCIHFIAWISYFCRFISTPRLSRISQAISDSSSSLSSRCVCICIFVCVKDKSPYTHIHTTFKQWEAIIDSHIAWILLIPWTYRYIRKGNRIKMIRKKRIFLFFQTEPHTPIYVFISIK